MSSSVSESDRSSLLFLTFTIRRHAITVITLTIRMTARPTDTTAQAGLITASSLALVPGMDGAGAVAGVGVMAGAIVVAGTAAAAVTAMDVAAMDMVVAVAMATDAQDMAADGLDTDTAVDALDTALAPATVVGPVADTPVTQAARTVADGLAAATAVVMPEALAAVDTLAASVVAVMLVAVATVAAGIANPLLTLKQKGMSFGSSLFFVFEDC